MYQLLTDKEERITDYEFNQLPVEEQILYKKLFPTTSMSGTPDDDEDDFVTPALTTVEMMIFLEGETDIDLI